MRRPQGQPQYAAAIESNLEFIMSQLAGFRRRSSWRYSVLVMVGMGCLVQTLALLLR
jgi:hypothetical protein